VTAIGRAVAAGATANLAMGTLFAWSLMAEQAAADVGATSTTTSAVFATAIATFQAKGIVMERVHLDADQAFTLLSRLSQEENTKLHDVAARIAAEASTPPTV